MATIFLELLAILAICYLCMPKKPQEAPSEAFFDGGVITMRQTLGTSKEVKSGIDTTLIKPYDKPVKTYIYRPQTLDQFIGQEQAKDEIRSFVKVVQELKPNSHLLINSWPGCGKTTLIYILANLLKAKLIYRTPQQIMEPESLIDIVNEINEAKEPYVVFALDEIHSIDPRVAETLYTVMEDSKLAGVNIRPFILAGATTELNTLQKKLSPLVDRFYTKITLSKYDPSELDTILHQYHKQLYANIVVKDIDILSIACNAKRTPRIAIGLLMKYLVEKDIDKVMKQSRIVINGLTNIDIRLLQVLKDNIKPMGAEALAQRASIPTSDYLVVYEPFLAAEGYINRTPRRVLGDKGKLILEQLGG